MHLSLNGAQERPGDGHGQLVVECLDAVWTYRYTNGYSVALRGKLVAHLSLRADPSPPESPPPPLGSYSWKIESLDFNSTTHEKSLSIDAILGVRIEPHTPLVRNLGTPVMTNGTINAQRSPEKMDDLRITIDRASIPSEPVNLFGIPQATMRCLEVSTIHRPLSNLIVERFRCAACRKRRAYGGSDIVLE